MFAVDRSMSDLAPGFSALSSSVEILIVHIGADGLIATAAAGAETVACTLAAGWSGLLLLDRVKFDVVGGRGSWRLGDIAALAKLQAFLDAGREDNAAPGTSNGGPSLISLAVGDPQDACDRRAVERWFLMQSSRPDGDFERMCGVLRGTEWYKLIRFLLTQPATRTMQALSARYGLSYSHFRLLCRQAFGRGGKAEFQQWRNVRALLDMVDCGGSLTDVALRQGFASSSHFSDAMKSQFGISPSNLTRVLKRK